MAMVVVDDSCLQADSQPKSCGLVWGSAAAWRCSTFIRWTDELLKWPQSWWQHYKYRPGYYYYYYWWRLLLLLMQWVCVRDREGLVRRLLCLFDFISFKLFLLFISEEMMMLTVCWWRFTECYIWCAQKCGCFYFYDNFSNINWFLNNYFTIMIWKSWHNVYFTQICKYVAAVIVFFVLWEFVNVAFGLCYVIPHHLLWI